MRSRVLLQQAFRGLELAEDLWRCWEDGNERDVREFLAGVEGLTAGDVGEVLRVDLYWRFRHSQPAKVEEYVAEFPALSRAVVLDLLFDELLLRQESGEPVSLDEYARRFPGYCDALHRQAGVDAALVSGEFFASDPLKGGGVGVPTSKGQEESAHAARGRFPDIPGYTIYEEIARGGMGIVYRARQLELERVVAIKMILSGRLAGDNEVRRLRREAQSAAKLHHPNIVAVYEVKEHEGHEFFSMEFVDGRSLAELVRNGPLGARTAAEQLRKIASAVHYAHEQGIVHRDLKPSNVMIDAKDEPRITDFGLSKQTTGAGSLTATDAILGTPNYMSPEQATAQHSEIGPLSDVYSLGAILYELVTGRPPHGSPDLFETLRQVKEMDPQPPHLLNAMVPRDLETICLKCLSKEPTRRYESAQALADDLERWLADEPIQARKVTARERLWRWTRRNPLTSILGATVVLSLVTGTLLTSYFWLEASERARDLGIANTRAEEKAAEALANLDLANESSRRAEESAHQSRQLSYGNQMTLAQVAMETRDTRRAWTLLNAQWPSPDRPDLRGFDWYCLWHLLGSEQTAFQGHRGRVTSLAYSPDGTQIATGGFDAEVRIWSVSSGRCESILKGHRAVVINVDFSSDGSLLASASGDSTIKLWNVKRRKLLATLEGHNTPVACVGFSPDDVRLASGSETGLKLWNRASLTGSQALNGHSDFVRCVDFSPDGRTLVSSSSDKTIAIWDVATALRILTLVGHQDVVHAIQFSPDGEMLASCSWDGTIRLWDTVEWTPRATLRGHQGIVRSICFSPDGTELVSAGEDTLVRVWDVASGHELASLEGHDGMIWDVAYSPDGRSFASVSDSPRVRMDASSHGSSASILLWDAKSRTRRSATVPWSDRAAQARRLPVWVWDVCLLGEQHLVFTAQEDGRIGVWNSETGDKVSDYVGHRDRVIVLAASPTGEFLASGGLDETACIWHVPEGRLERNWKLNGAVHSLAFDRSGRTLTALTAHGEVSTLAIEHGRAAKSHFVYHPNIQSMAQSPTGGLLATGGDDSIARIWDFENDDQRRSNDNRQPRFELLGHDGPVRSIAFSPDGTILATGSYDHTARLWDVETGSLRNVLRAHLNQITDLAFSPDGRRLATASHDKTAKLWDVETGNELVTLRGHLDELSSVTFSPDGMMMAVGVKGFHGKKYGQVVLWRGASPEELLEDCRRHALLDANDTESQIALSLCHWNLARSSNDASTRKKHLDQALEVLRGLRSDGRLLQEQVRWIEDIEASQH